MNKTLRYVFSLSCVFTLISPVAFGQSAEAEWRLTNVTFNTTDPDGAGPATGSATFTLQVRAVGGTLANITAITTGWSWQSANAMIPTTAGGTGIAAPGCTSPVNNPGNVDLSDAFTDAAYSYNTVNQCFIQNQEADGQAFDRTVIGTLESSTNGLNITTAWTDVFTVTLWTLNNTAPQGGYVIINSSNLGSPGGFGNYEIADIEGNPFQANSLTYTTALALTGTPLPVEFTRFTVQCSPTGNSILWNTAAEKDNSHFEVQKSSDGSTWTSIGRVNSNSNRTYQLTDKTGGQAMYRVKQVDLNGAVSYTDIVRTNCGNSALLVNLYPTPARDKLTLVVSSDRPINTKAQVFDNNGRVVMNVQLPVVRGTNTFFLNVGHLPQGQYYLRSTDENRTISQRFTIAR